MLKASPSVQQQVRTSIINHLLSQDSGCRDLMHEGYKTYLENNSIYSDAKLRAPGIHGTMFQAGKGGGSSSKDDYELV